MYLNARNAAIAQSEDFQIHSPTSEEVLYAIDQLPVSMTTLSCVLV